MLDKFDLESLYIFSENKYYLYNGKKFTWTSICDGLIIEPETEYIGIAKVEGEEYVVFPYSCNKIGIDVKSTEKENIYGNDVIGTIQTKSSFQGGKPKEFEGKIFFGKKKDKGDIYIWKDAGILSLDNLDEINNSEYKPLNNHSKELVFDINKEYYFDVNLVDKKDIKDWMYKCSGVNVYVTSKNKGLVCEVFAEICHTVFRKWCREITD